MKFFKRKNKTDVSDNKRQRVYSYYAASSQQLNKYQRQSAAKAKQQISSRRWRLIAKNWFYVLLGAMVAVVFLYSLTLQGAASISVQGTKYRKDSDYTKIVNNILSENWLNHFKPTMNEEKLSQKLEEAIPEATEVTVSAPFLGRRPDVKIYTEKPLAVFAQSETEKYILSERGRVLLPVGESDKSVANLPAIYNKTGVKLEEGKQFLPPIQAAALENIINMSQASSISGINFEIPVQPLEVLLIDKNKGNFYGRFLLDEPTINQQYGAYLAVLNKLGAEKPAEYIDARLADRVFIK